MTPTDVCMAWGAQWCVAFRELESTGDTEKADKMRDGLREAIDAAIAAARAAARAACAQICFAEAARLQDEVAHRRATWREEQGCADRLRMAIRARSNAVVSGRRDADGGTKDGG